MHIRGGTVHQKKSVPFSTPVTVRGACVTFGSEMFVGMASGKELERDDVPAALYRSAVWDHFAFRVTYDDGGMKVVDKSVTVCKHFVTCCLCQQ